MLARRERRPVEVDDGPRLAAGGEIGVEPGRLGRAHPLGVEDDEMNVPVVIRIPALDSFRSAVLWQDEGLPEGGGVLRLVFVVAARRKDREVLQRVGVHRKEEPFELVAGAAFIGDVAQVNHEVERHRFELLEQLTLLEPLIDRLVFRAARLVVFDVDRIALQHGRRLRRSRSTQNEAAEGQRQGTSGGTSGRDAVHG